MLDVIWIV